MMTRGALIEMFTHTIPWRKMPLDFHDYFMQVHYGRVQVDSFLLFGDGLHEVAHLICCEDADVLDPYWGLGPVGDPDFATTNIKEIEVMTVSFMLYIVHDGCFEGICDFEDRQEGITEDIEAFVGEWLFSPEQVTEKIQKTFKRFKNLQALKTEYDRKAELVKQLLS